MHFVSNCLAGIRKCPSGVRGSEAGPRCREGRGEEAEGGPDPHEAADGGD